VGFEPTETCASHAFQACRFGRSRTPPGIAFGRLSATHERLLSDIVTARFRRVRWRSGPVQPTLENQVRVGRQQPSSETSECRRPPGRHFSRRRRICIIYLYAMRIASQNGIGGTPNDAFKTTRSTRLKPAVIRASSNFSNDQTLKASV
jgi:hypothetical protein